MIAAGARDVHLAVDALGALRADGGDAFEWTDVSRWCVSHWCQWFEARPTEDLSIVIKGFQPPSDAAGTSSSTWAGTLVAVVYALEAARLSGVGIAVPDGWRNQGSWDMDAVPAAAVHESGSYACRALAVLFQSYASSDE